MKKPSMRCLMVGTGSIGRRHIRSLQALVEAPEFIFLREGRRTDALSEELGAQVVGNYDEALQLLPDVAVVASPTMCHADALEWLLPHGVPCYIEKPVVATEVQLQRVRTLLGRLPSLPATVVGCNLRYLGSLQRLRQMVGSGAIGRPARAVLQVGQWLPDWRPAQDYRQSYSARADAGGGVVLDLVHELDAVRWIFGEFERVHALGGKYSRLEIQAEDVAAIILGRGGGPAVSVCLDYVSRRPLRRYEVVGDEASMCWSLPDKSLRLSGNSGIGEELCGPESYDLGPTYVAAMDELLAAIHGRHGTTQDIHEGLKSAALAIAVNSQLRNS